MPGRARSSGEATPARKAEKLPSFDVSSNREAFQLQLEMTGKLSDLAIAEKVGQLTKALRGDAQLVLLNLPPASLADYAALAEMIAQQKD
ncbi:UNVERIFIED_CONTAM: hypothetical protein FKN15_019136 [Acipenser sinensis]